MYYLYVIILKGYANLMNVSVHTFYSKKLTMGLRAMILLLYSIYLMVNLIYVKTSTLIKLANAEVMSSIIHLQIMSSTD